MLDRGYLYLAAPVSFPTLHLSEQLRQAHIQSSGYPVEVDDADVALASSLGSTLVGTLGGARFGFDAGPLKAVLGG